MRSSARLAAVVATFAAAAGFYVAVKKAGERRDDPAAGSPLSSSTRAARSLELARIGGAAGAGAVAHKARRALAGSEQRARLDDAFQLHTAEQVAEVLGGMKGALMKLGQMASYLDQGLPEPVRAALAQLQADAPPMSAELAVATIEAELGAPVGELFAAFDEAPMAAASIGQVHRAVLDDGREVAVKVQYPGGDEAIRADLANAGLLVQAIGMLFPGLEPAPIVEELRARLLEELDYRHEATDQQRFADAYRGHPFIHVPDVVAARSTGRVLTTELAAGARFGEVVGWTQAERDLAGEAIYRFVFRSLWKLHMFNGDPHPGNYLFRPGGQVTFLDFGLVKHFDAGELQPMGDMIDAAVLHRDIGALRRAGERAGYVQPGAPVSDEELAEYFDHFYEFIAEDAPKTVTPAWSSESVRRYFDQSGGHGDVQRTLNVPAPYVVLQRINLGLLAVLGELHATANWRRIAEELWPWIDAPPSTPLGEAEADWLAARARST